MTTHLAFIMTTRAAWTCRLALATSLLSAGSCGGGEPDRPDPARARYEADRAHCDSISSVEAARRSCMTYRGWPDGKYRR